MGSKSCPKTLVTTDQLVHFVLFNTHLKGIKIFAPFEKIMEKPKKRIKMFLRGQRLQSPKPIQEDIFKLLLFKYPTGTLLKMGLVVPFAKEITNNHIFKLQEDINKINVRSRKGKDNLSKEVKDRLVRDKDFWISNFYSTYQNEHEKNERLYVSQWTRE